MPRSLTADDLLPAGLIRYLRDLPSTPALALRAEVSVLHHAAAIVIMQEA